MSRYSATLLENINTQVVSRGYRLTPQRKAVLDVLMDHGHEHLSAEDIFLKVREDCPDIGLATVYRTLDLLSELTVADRIHFGDGVVRYKLRSGTQAHMPHHLICGKCGAVSEIEEDWLAELEARVEREYGFTISDHRLDFTGHYNRCGKKSCKRKAVS